jgi:hypothetical protein
MHARNPQLNQEIHEENRLEMTIESNRVESKVILNFSFCCSVMSDPGSLGQSLLIWIFLDPKGELT